jgi:hypothetical protein
MFAAAIGRHIDACGHESIDFEMRMQPALRQAAAGAGEKFANSVASEAAVASVQILVVEFYFLRLRTALRSRKPATV